jgi:soluble lytic murein transglycosylase-like protein
MFSFPIPISGATNGLTPGQGSKQTPPDQIDFQNFLRESQMKALQVFASSEKSSEIGGINPFKNYSWILNIMNKGIGGPSSLGKEALSTFRIDKAYGLEGTSKIPISGLSETETAKDTDILSLAKDTAKKYGIPESFFLKLIKSESNFDPSAKSPKGAMGLGQLMPKTAEEFGLRIDNDGAPGSVWDPKSNLDASANYLDRLQKLYRSKGVDSEEVWKLSAGAYNAGMGNIQKAIDKMPEGSALKWDQVAQTLPQVTGRSSQETIGYVGKIFS